ncbi:MAG: hypothetical protein QOE59_2987 [Actinomycetota bacterium]|jgi:NTE family protein|nr:hypothetical protein [Actinomycetota bacterium]
MSWNSEGDAVFRGGGVKGIAFGGALEAFASDPRWPITRWVNLAGASAGAIVASYLAVGHTASECMTLLQETDFRAFEDVPGGRFTGAITSLIRRGYATGDYFRDWFDDEIGSATFSQVRKEDDSEGGWRLKLIAADVSRKRLLVLPDDLVDYRRPGSQRLIDPEEFKIADAVRMSMSIPYFFEPIVLEDRTGSPCTIIDGGTLSNFPVWIFDVDPSRVGRTPSRPTFGFTLVGGHSVGDQFADVVRRAPWPVRLAADIFSTAQDAWDARFASHSTSVRTIAISAGDVGTTDFDLTTEAQGELIANGRQAVRQYLRDFDPDTYVNTFGASLNAT